MKKPITCNLCEFSACYKCFSKFILECTLNPKCMKCDKPWSRKHLVNSFGQYFVTHTYKAKRENVLFDIEKAMLPTTQPMAAQILEMKRLQKEIDKHDVDSLELRMIAGRIDKGILDSEFDDYLANRKNVMMQYHDHREEMFILESKKDRIARRNRNERNWRSHTHRSCIFVKCPGNECRGFAMSKASGLECDLCKTVLCKECHDPMGQTEHTCDPNTLETVRLLKRDSKNCPNCKSMIFKIDGCDQMFCTQCHTAFSWRTGEVVSGRIHNPHYYEYLRRSGNQERELGDVPCGGVPPATSAITNRRNYSRIHQIVTHVDYDALYMLRIACNAENSNQDMRILYLNNETTLEAFKHEIYRREKALEKKREIMGILTTFVVVCSDIFRNIIADTAVYENEASNLEQFESIRKFTNDSLMDVSRVYRCVVPFIDSSWVYGSRNYFREE